jgi:hypothetical protein
MELMALADGIRPGSIGARLTEKDALGISDGPLGAATIRRELETRFWGPGRLRATLVEARRRGLVRRVGTRTFEAAD